MNEYGEQRPRRRKPLTESEKWQNWDRFVGLHPETNRQQIYFFNHVTTETQWHKPACLRQHELELETSECVVSM